MSETTPQSLGVEPDWQRTTREYLLKLLAKLSEKQRMLIILKEVEGYSIRELAKQTGTAESVVKQRLSRATARLKQAAVEFPPPASLIPSLEHSFLAQFPDRPQILRVVTEFGNLLQGIDVRHEDLLMLSARQFEELVAELWSRLGYEVELTLPTRDGGRDVIAVRRSEANLRFLIECKRYSPPRKVGVAPVRSLYGVKTHENATKGILATTSSFTSEALRLFAAHYWELEPRDYEGVLAWIKLANKTNHEPNPSIWSPRSKWDQSGLTHRRLRPKQ
jgi:hypothetical protein